MTSDYGRKDNGMLIRRTEIADVDEVMQIFADARMFMRNTGNKNQWNSKHPSHELIMSDINGDTSFVVEDDGEIIGSFFFKIGEDPTYKTIYEGQWINNDKYGVIHRIAVKYRGRGVASFIYDHCFNIIKNLRIDTHRDNAPMQRSLEKSGFKYCGIIYLESGDMRIAFQKAE